MIDNPASEPPLHIEVSIDLRQALKSGEARLHSEFADTFDLETVERLLYSSYDQLADRATIHDFLALLAERFTRQRLRTLARWKANQLIWSGGDQGQLHTGMRD